MASANQLAPREPVKALAELWQALDLYEQSVISARANVPPPVTATEARAATEPATPPLPAPSPAASPGPAVPPQSIPRPPAPAPAPALTPAPAAASAVDRPIAAGQTPVPPPEEAVLQAVERYRLAYEALDVAQLTQVFPSVNAAKLRDAFEQTQEYRMEISDRRVLVKADEATVDAVVSRRITMTVGRQTQTQPPTNMRFVLNRKAGQWIITDLIVR
jgi:hypothetical protein